jgi:hypothetical protein
MPDRMIMGGECQELIPAVMTVVSTSEMHSSGVMGPGRSARFCQMAKTREPGHPRNLSEESVMSGHQSSSQVSD